MKKAMYFTNKNDWNEFRHKGLQASGSAARSCEPFENDFQDRTLTFGNQRSMIQNQYQKLQEEKLRNPSRAFENPSNLQEKGVQFQNPINEIQQSYNLQLTEFGTESQIFPLMQNAIKSLPTLPTITVNNEGRHEQRRTSDQIAQTQDEHEDQIIDLKPFHMRNMHGGANQVQDSAGAPINCEQQTSYRGDPSCRDDRQESTLNMSGSKGSKESLIPSQRDPKIKREFGKSENQAKNAVSTSKISPSSSDHSQISKQQSKETVSSHMDIKNIAPMEATSSIKQTNLQVNTNLRQPAFVEDMHGSDIKIQDININEHQLIPQISKSSARVKPLENLNHELSNKSPTIDEIMSQALLEAKEQQAIGQALSHEAQLGGSDIMDPVQRQQRCKEQMQHRTENGFYTRNRRPILEQLRNHPGTVQSSINLIQQVTDTDPQQISINIDTAQQQRMNQSLIQNQSFKRSEIMYDSKKARNKMKAFQNWLAGNHLKNLKQQFDKHKTWQFVKKKGYQASAGIEEAGHDYESPQQRFHAQDDMRLAQIDINEFNVLKRIGEQDEMQKEIERQRAESSQGENSATAEFWKEAERGDQSADVQQITIHNQGEDKSKEIDTIDTQKVLEYSDHPVSALCTQEQLRALGNHTQQLTKSSVLTEGSRNLVKKSKIKERTDYERADGAIYPIMQASSSSHLLSCDKDKNRRETMKHSSNIDQMKESFDRSQITTDMASELKLLHRQNLSCSQNIQQPPEVNNAMQENQSPEISKLKDSIRSGRLDPTPPGLEAAGALELAQNRQSHGQDVNQLETSIYYQNKEQLMNDASAGMNKQISSEKVLLVPKIEHIREIKLAQNQRGNQNYSKAENLDIRSNLESSHQCQPAYLHDDGRGQLRSDVDQETDERQDAYQQRNPRQLSGLALQQEPVRQVRSSSNKINVRQSGSQYSNLSLWNQKKLKRSEQTSDYSPEQFGEGQQINLLVKGKDMLKRRYAGTAQGGEIQVHGDKLLADKHRWKSPYLLKKQMRYPPMQNL